MGKCLSQVYKFSLEPKLKYTFEWTSLGETRPSSGSLNNNYYNKWVHLYSTKYISADVLWSNELNRWVFRHTANVKQFTEWLHARLLTDKALPTHVNKATAVEQCAEMRTRQREKCVKSWQ